MPHSHGVSGDFMLVYFCAVEERGELWQEAGSSAKLWVYGIKSCWAGGSLRHPADFPAHRFQGMCKMESYSLSSFSAMTAH